MKLLPKRCECLWCRQVFYSDQYYKYGTCSSCLIAKTIVPAPKLADILRQAEHEAARTVRSMKKSGSNTPQR
jgi:hypothetical protein